SQQVAQSMGIPVRRMFALAWAIAAVVAAIGGILLGAVRTGVDQSLALIGLKVLPVVILGGLDSVGGAILGGPTGGGPGNLGGGVGGRRGGGFARPAARRWGEGGRALHHPGRHPDDQALRVVRQDADREGVSLINVPMR